MLHGSNECGKDLVVIQADSKIEIFQAKIGDLKTKEWRQVKPQLEEIFEVPLPEFLLGKAESPSIVGILVFNGDVRPEVLPRIYGWISDQKQAYGRIFEIWDINKVLNFIERKNLFEEFRKICFEIGIEKERGSL
ncbi:MAG: hypothetical protein IPN95_29440 [Bacteroidetes bacterium]|nr:hypothetical protein [Bacteroidota bacterium]